MLQYFWEEENKKYQNSEKSRWTMFHNSAEKLFHTESIR